MTPQVGDLAWVRGEGATPAFLGRISGVGGRSLGGPLTYCRIQAFWPGLSPAETTVEVPPERIASIWRPVEML
jgi:hypothetical protein